MSRSPAGASRSDRPFCRGRDKEHDLSQPTENLRVRRTRKLLRDALVELIEERGFDRLTVTEITERAMVSRAAFYRSHWSKYDLVEQIFDEAMGELFATLSDDQQPRQRWPGFFDHVSSYDRLYRALLGTNGSSWFAAKTRSTLAARITEHLTHADPPSKPPPTAARATQPELVPTLLAGMAVDAISWWLGQQPPPPTEQMAGRTERLGAAILAEASTWASTEV